MRERDLYIADYARRCAHFNGINNTACKAGVAYSDVRAAKRADQMLPCIGGDAVCASKRCYTAEEAGEKYDREEKSAGHCVAAMTAISEKFEVDKQERGTIECPSCKGRLRYAVAKRGRGLFMQGRCACGVGFLT